MQSLKEHESQYKNVFPSSQLEGWASNWPLLELPPVEVDFRFHATSFPPFEKTETGSMNCSLLRARDHRITRPKKAFSMGLRRVVDELLDCSGQLSSHPSSSLQHLKLSGT